MTIGNDRKPDAVALRSYRISLSIPVLKRGTLVVYAYPNADNLHLPIAGSEVFPLNHRNVVWQIDLEPGTTESRVHEFDRTIEATKPSENVYRVGYAFYASRFNGYTFIIDLNTGYATYIGWGRT